MSLMLSSPLGRFVAADGLSPNPFFYQILPEFTRLDCADRTMRCRGNIAREGHALRRGLGCADTLREFVQSLER